MKTKIFTLLLTLMVGTHSLFATGGSFGGFTWNLSAGVLTISGSGWMEGGGYGEYPWFDLRSSITSVVIEDGVYNIAPCAFIDCANLTTVSIPNTIEEIGRDAFGLCSSLTTITLPRSLTTIGGGAFVSCSSLTSVKCEAVTPPTIGDYDQPQIIYPESPIALYVPAGSIALYQNSEIWDDFSPILPLTQYCGDNLTWVWDLQTDSLFISGTGAMWDFINYNTPWTNYSVKGVTFSEGITTIGNRAFESGRKIQSITIPSTVSYIGTHAFYGCLSLQKMVCEAVVPPTLADSSSLKFGGRSNSLPVCLYVPAESVEAYKAADYWKNMTKILPIGTTETYCGENLIYEVVDGALTISGTGDMWNYYYSSNATTAPWGPDITSVSLPEGLTSVGDFAFYQCKNITSITIPSTITYLGLAAFYHCGVDYNGSDADAIINLTSVTCLAPTPPSMSSGSYGGLMGIGPVFGPVICLDGGNLCTYFYGQQVPLYVPAGSIELYQTADQWEYFNPILPISQATEVENSVIQATPEMNSVVLEWTMDSEAASYTIEIKQDQTTVFTLVFDDQGQLENITQNAPARSTRGIPQQKATQTTSGWQYTVGGLEANTDYTYTVVARREDTSEVYNTTIPFKTQSTPTAIDQIDSSSLQGGDRGRLILHNGQIFILRGDKTYTLTGQEVK